MAPDRGLIVREWGHDGDPVVVCWPGLSIHAHAHFDEAGPALAEGHGLHVAAVEPPGWTSPPLAPEQYRPSALARRVVELVDRNERAAYVGWSWGASIGCHVGALASERLTGLVLLDAGYTDLQDDESFVERVLGEAIEEARAEPFRFESWEAYLAAVRGRTRTWRPALEARARAGMREEDGRIVPLVAPEAVAAAWHGVAVERPSEAVRDIRCPVLLVAATETLARLGDGPLERFRAGVPHAEVVTIDSGHDVLADAPDETVAAVGAFLARVAVPPPVASD